MYKIIFVLFLLVNVVYAQEKPLADSLRLKDTTSVTPADSSHAELKDTVGWKIESTFDLKFSQVSLNNWASGGQSSKAFNTAFSFSADYIKNHFTWTNTIDLDYGLFNQAKSPYWVKSDDRIELNSLAGHIAWKHWEYESFISFRSQFSSTYSNPMDRDSLKITISNFMAPAFIGLGVGVDYKPSEKFNLLVAPLSAKITVVNNQTLADLGSFGVPNQLDTLGNPIKGSGKKVRKEVGGTFKVMYKTQISEKFDLHARLDLFSNYLNNPQNIDVNCEVLANWKINKYLSVSINLVLIYDDDVNITRETGQIDQTTGLRMTRTGPITQFREISGLGFNYSF